MRITPHKFLIGCILVAHAALAQQVVAPTPDQAGSPRGDNTGDYNVMESFETGYRFAVVDGSVGTYRSDVNYGNGITAAQQQSQRELARRPWALVRPDRAHHHRAGQRPVSVGDSARGKEQAIPL